MTALQNCLNYLRSSRVRFAHTNHSAACTPEDVALAEHIPPNRLAKTVILRGNEGFVMAVIPAGCYVDLGRLRTTVGVPDLCVPEERELWLLFPRAEVGTMPPLGSLFNLPVYLDRKVANREFIAFNAGTHRDVIHMRVVDFRDLVRPMSGDFCQTAELAHMQFV